MNQEVKAIQWICLSFRHEQVEQSRYRDDAQQAEDDQAEIGAGRNLDQDQLETGVGEIGADMGRDLRPGAEAQPYQQRVQDHEGQRQRQAEQDDRLSGGERGPAEGAARHRLDRQVVVRRLPRG